MKLKTESKQGYALATMIGIMTVMAISFSMLVTIGQQQVFQGNLLKDRTKATAYAEAGIEFAYSVFRDDFKNYKTPQLFRLDTSKTHTSGEPLTSSYGDGTFTLSLTDVNSDGQYIILNSVGTCGKSKVSAEILVEDSFFDKNSGGDAFKNAVSGGGSGKIGGGGTVGPQGKYHLDGDLAKNGSVTINVDISAGGTISGNAPVAGSETPNASKIGTPVINFNEELKVAAKNGEIYNGKTFFKKDYEIPGGVAYIDGDVTVMANIKGTIIATGNITVTKGGITKTVFNIAAGSTTGDLSYGSNGDSHGLFYTQHGNFSQTAGLGSITGQIIVGGDVSKTGGGDLIFEVNIPPGVETGSNPVVAGWQE